MSTTFSHEIISQHQDLWEAGQLVFNGWLGFSLSCLRLAARRMTCSTFHGISRNPVAILEYDLAGARTDPGKKVKKTRHIWVIEIQPPKIKGFLETPSHFSSTRKNQSQSQPSFEAPEFD